MKVLLIDDNPGACSLLAPCLQGSFGSVDCVEVTRRQDFEAALVQGGFDIVITECQLNWTDALWILQRCLEDDPARPVIMFTDRGSEEIAVEAMKNGLSDYVLK